MQQLEAPSYRLVTTVPRRNRNKFILLNAQSNGMTAYQADSLCGIDRAIEAASPHGPTVTAVFTQHHLIIH